MGVEQVPAAADAGAGEGDVRVADRVDLALAVVVDAHVDPLRGEVAGVGERVGVLAGRDRRARARLSAAGPVGRPVKPGDLHERRAGEPELLLGPRGQVEPVVIAVQRAGERLACADVALVQDDAAAILRVGDLAAA